MPGFDGLFAPSRRGAAAVELATTILVGIPLVMALVIFSIFELTKLLTLPKREILYAAGEESEAAFTHSMARLAEVHGTTVKIDSPQRAAAELGTVQSAN
jgi:hypothetical protein